MPPSATAPTRPQVTGAGPGTGTTADPAARPSPGHLWQVDIVRLLTFAAVIAVHVLAFTEQPGNRAVAGAMMLLQYGREVFFALTAFVLVYSTRGRPVRLGSFWRRRLVLVAVPYVVWSGIYFAYSVLGPQHAPLSVAAFGWDLLSGGAEYHLYFLLVTMQLYLAFPLILALVRRTAHRAVPVLAGVTVANLAWFAACQYLPTPSGAGGWLFQHAYELLPSYSMYVLAGAYAALHLERIQRFVDRRPRVLLAGAGVSAALALLVYAVQLPYMAPRAANDVLQPGMALSCLAAVSVVYLIGSRWAEGPRRHQGSIETLSDASFGVYLAHPLILALLLDYAGFGNDGQRLYPVLATVFGYVIATGGAVLITLAARRTPLSLPLAGRPWRAAVKRPASPGPAPVAARTGPGPRTVAAAVRPAPADPLPLPLPVPARAAPLTAATSDPSSPGGARQC